LVILILILEIYNRLIVAALTGVLVDLCTTSLVCNAGKSNLKLDLACVQACKLIVTETTMCVVSVTIISS